LSMHPDEEPSALWTVRSSSCSAELWRKLGDDEVRKAAYRGRRRTCQNLHEGAIRHERG
jgi:hypothetical protein